MIRPPCGSCARIKPKATFAQIKLPVMLMSIRLRHAATSISSTVLDASDTPALLNSTSRWPHCAAAFPNASTTDASSLTSQGIANAFSCVAATASKASALRPTRPTFQPASRNASAVALPIPRPPPVMMILFVMDPCPYLLWFLNIPGERSGGRAPNQWLSRGRSWRIFWYAVANSKHPPSDNCPTCLR